MRLTDEELTRLEEQAVAGSYSDDFALILDTIAEVREHRAHELAHAQNHCLDCEGPLVQCDCHKGCPGGMCARKCHEEPRGPVLTAEDVEALAWLVRHWGRYLGPRVMNDPAYREKERVLDVLTRLTNAGRRP